MPVNKFANRYARSVASQGNNDLQRIDISSYNFKEAIEYIMVKHRKTLKKEKIQYKFFDLPLTHRTQSIFNAYVWTTLLLNISIFFIEKIHQYVKIAEQTYRYPIYFYSDQAGNVVQIDHSRG